jgi:hypothetical protein
LIKSYVYFLFKQKNSSEKPKVIKDDENRGFCTHFKERTLINSLIDDGNYDDSNDAFKTVNKE